MQRQRLKGFGYGHTPMLGQQIGILKCSHWEEQTIWNYDTDDSMNELRTWNSCSPILYHRIDEMNKNNDFAHCAQQIGWNSLQHEFRLYKSSHYSPSGRTKCRLVQHSHTWMGKQFKVYIYLWYTWKTSLCLPVSKTDSGGNCRSNAMFDSRRCSGDKITTQGLRVARLGREDRKRGGREQPVISTLRILTTFQHPNGPVSPSYYLGL